MAKSLIALGAEYDKAAAVYRLFQAQPDWIQHRYTERRNAIVVAVAKARLAYVRAGGQVR